MKNLLQAVALFGLTVAVLCFAGLVIDNTHDCIAAESAGWGGHAAARQPAPAAPATVAPAEKPTSNPGMKLTWRERRKLGVTFSNVRRHMKEMEAEGYNVEELSQSEVGLIILDRLAGENPELFREPGLDWDALLDFLERLFELIMRFFVI